VGTEQYAIETDGLSKIYRRHSWSRSKPTLTGLSVQVKEREIYGFLGKNGAGKTTTIKILCGLMRGNRGTARIMGRDVRSRDARKLVGYLPENPYFYEYLTPKETIEFYGRLRGLDKAERRREWDRLSEQLDLHDIANQRVRGFSKGMRQRLGFAVALVGNPPVLVLDEPMSGLDPMGRRRIRDLIVTLRDQKKTIFFSSHVLSDVELISDRVGMLVNGKLHRQGVMDDLLATRVHLVEVVARDIPDHVVSMLVANAYRSRHSETGHHFSFPDLDRANEAACEVQMHGGTLVEFAPVRESLEDYFVREQVEMEVTA
jgi:ABC-2 type transport system ATP-binding protein